MSVQLDEESLMDALDQNFAELALVTVSETKMMIQMEVQMTQFLSEPNNYRNSDNKSGPLHRDQCWYIFVTNGTFSANPQNCLHIVHGKFPLVASVSR